MFLINYQVKPSGIDGLGVFSAQNIKEDDLVYRHSPKLDLTLSKEEFNLLPVEEKTLITHYGYVEKGTGNYRLDHDDIRFVNHSDSPNIGLNANGELSALRAIKSGEELLQNYRDFENEIRF